MTAQQSSSSGSSSALIARKGTASPLGLRRPRIVAEGEAQPEAESPAAGDAAQDAKTKPIQLELVSGLEPAAGEASNEPPPAASLFPFSLRRALREQGDTWELVSPDLLARMAAVSRESPESSESPAAKEGPALLDQAVSAESAPPAELAPETTETAESVETAATPDAIETMPETASEPAAAPAAAKTPMALPPVGPLAKSADPVARITPHVTGKPAAKAPNAAAAPVADPSWRIGVEKLPSAESGGSKRMLAMVAAAVVAIAAIGWWSYSAQDSAPGEAPAAPATVADTAPQAPQEIAPAASAGGADVTPAAAPAAAGTETQSAAPQAPTHQAPAPEAKEPAPASQDAATPAPTAEPSVPAPAIAPSVDLVRIEPNGDAVIAGRAAPNAELILLDNGKPIGTVQADAFGEWVYVPEQPLNDGSHEFGLVVKSVEGKVSVPAEAPKSSAPPAQTAPDDAAQPAPAPENGASLSTGQGGDEAGAVPVPPRKPDGAINSGVPIPVRKPVLHQGQAPGPVQDSTTAGAASSDFVVQLASVKTHAGARREWEKLQSRFPEYLGGMNLNLDEAKLSQRGTVVRVRTGPFSDLNEARDFCARMLAENQDCLVLRTTGEKLSLVAR
jgi:hypothetical protein